MSKLGEAATHLPWLSPCAASLVALTRAPTDAAWEKVRLDPGCVLLIVRQAAGLLATPSLSFFPTMLRHPAILEGAARFLDQPGPGFVDWNQPAFQPTYRASLLYARSAQVIAEKTGRSDPANAWIAGMLAPLGWLALAAVQSATLDFPLPTANGQARPDNRTGHPLIPTSDFDPASIARRLARHWRLPAWLSATIGHLGLHFEIAQSLGADPDLFRIVQLAVGLTQHAGHGLELAVDGRIEETADELGLGTDEQQALSRDLNEWLETPPAPREWQAPAAMPLLRDLINLAAENRRLADAPLLDRLESDVDTLQKALQAQRAGEDERLRSLKLTALAEMAAGAGHEINNPLAVISGQAQYLLTHEPEPARQRALQTIIGQAQRIHEIIIELMQFARPPRPLKQEMDLGSLIRDVTGSLSDYAVQQQVQLVCPETEYPIRLHADPRQLRIALSCLLRNAIQAAPKDGWAGVRVVRPQPDRIDLVVEDNGQGPAPEQREHLFDPFYSGRSAGRGRGLGLSTAWRLVREQGGEVYFDELSAGPTRFVLSLPQENGECHGNGSIAEG